MQKSCLFILVAFVMTGCVRSSEQLPSPVHLDGRAKPKVIFVPVVDRTKNNLSWNLGQEFTNTFEEKIIRSGQLYSFSDSPSIGKQIREWGRPALENPLSIKKISPDVEFVVWTEIVDHVVKNNRTVVTALYIEVIDLRGVFPKTILKETLKRGEKALIKVPQTSYDEEGSLFYPVTLLGWAHDKLIDEAYTHIEDYILLAKTR